MTAGPGGHLSWTAALAVQLGFSLFMAQDGRINPSQVISSRDAAA
ncbi:hypothetical protein [Actinomadura vinacea]